jgi:hypothetical protein
MADKLLTHAEFTAAHSHGEIRIGIDPQAAARYLSARLLLPFVMMPVLGIGVALALTGWIFTGLAVIAAGILAPRLIKRAAPHFILTQALQDPAVYLDVTRSGLLRTTLVTSDSDTSPPRSEDR